MCKTSKKKIMLTYQGVIYSKKNSKRIIRNRRTGQMALISSEAAQANERDMITQFKSQATQTWGNDPCKINIEIFEPNYTRRDLDNQATSILDALKVADIIVDDDYKHVTEINTKLGGIDKSNPRAIITISEAK